MNCSNIYCIARNFDGECDQGSFFDECPVRISYEADHCPTEEEYKRTNQLTLHLPIKTEWLDMIAVGIKLEEYREIKPYWTKRLCKKVDDREFLTDYYKEYTHVKFHNYGKSLPVYADLIKIHIGEGKEEWGAVKGECYHVITIDNPVQDLPF